MTEEEYNTIGYGNVLYCDKEGVARFVVEVVKKEKGNDDSPTTMLYTRDPFKVGRYGLNNEWRDIGPEEIEKWKVFTSIQEVRSHELRARMLIYEVERLKFILSQVAPDMFSQTPASNFIPL